MTTLVTPVPADQPTFAMAERCDDLATLEADIAIIGTPYGVIYPSYSDRPRYSEGAESIRKHSQKFGKFRDHYDFDLGGAMLDGRPIRIVDCGDVMGDPDGGSENHAKVEEAVRLIRSHGATVITLGGNDGTSTPVMRGLDASSNVSIVHFDAHLDYRDEVEGLNDGWSSSMRRASEMEHMGKPVHLGLRGVGSARAQDVMDAKANGSTFITAREIYDRGSRDIAHSLPTMEDIYIHFDVDVMDLAIASGAGAPAMGGLGYWQATDLLQGTANRGRIVAAHFSSFIPSLDPSGITSMLVAQLIMNLMSAMARSGQFDR
ncbi:MAG: arginase family protein [Thermomicrobiales bacterium]|nr:arginase family protein [Thermomicrobiales bacterium]